MIKFNDLIIVFNPSSSIQEEIIRNVRIILTTFTGSVPYDRDFGISIDLLDMPISVVTEMYVVECLTKVRKYEPRARIESVNYSSEPITGALIPKVVLTIEPE